MSWNTENTDPIGDLCKMKVAMESAPTYRIYVNPIDMLSFERAGIFSEGQPFVYVDDNVPLGYILLNDTLIDCESIMAMCRPYETPSICFNNLSQPQPQPRNRAERRAAMKKMKNRREVRYHG